LKVLEWEWEGGERVVWELKIFGSSRYWTFKDETQVQVHTSEFFGRPGNASQFGKHHQIVHIHVDLVKKAVTCLSSLLPLLNLARHICAAGY
jgi:hypothetical protein